MASPKWRRFGSVGNTRRRRLITCCLLWPAARRFWLGLHLITPSPSSHLSLGTVFVFTIHAVGHWVLLSGFSQPKTCERSVKVQLTCRNGLENTRYSYLQQSFQTMEYDWPMPMARHNNNSMLEYIAEVFNAGEGEKSSSLHGTCVAGVVASRVTCDYLSHDQSADPAGRCVCKADKTFEQFRCWPN